MKVAAFLKIAVMATLVASVCGCADMAGRVIQSSWTPSLEKCEGLQGKTLTDFKVQIGSPDIEADNIQGNGAGERNYTFSKGIMYAYVTLGADNKITNIECWKDENKNPPSKRRAQYISNTYTNGKTEFRHNQGGPN